MPEPQADVLAGIVIAALSALKFFGH